MRFVSEQPSLASQTIAGGTASTGMVASLCFSQAGAAILIVNKNFGCGSSREHAPQGLFRFGIRAIVGESFSEIFRGNASMIGLPCFAADHASVDRLQAAIERSPAVTLEADVAAGIVRAGDAQSNRTGF